MDEYMEMGLDCSLLQLGRRLAQLDHCQWPVTLVWLLQIAHSLDRLIAWVCLPP